MILKKTWFGSALVFCALTMFGSVQSNAAEVKIGTVDMQKVLQSVEEGKKAKKNLEKTFNKRKKELQKKEAKIKEMHEKFQKKSLVMSEKARAKKQAEIQQKIIELQQETAQSQQELAQIEAQLKNPIIGKIRKLISEIAEKKKYTVVLEKNKNSVLYSLDKNDLTEEIIKIYNKSPSS